VPRAQGLVPRARGFVPKARKFVPRARRFVPEAREGVSAARAVEPVGGRMAALRLRARRSIHQSSASPHKTAPIPQKNGAICLLIFPHNPSVWPPSQTPPMIASSPTAPSPSGPDKAISASDSPSSSANPRSGSRRLLLRPMRGSLTQDHSIRSDEWGWACNLEASLRSGLLERRTLQHGVCTIMGWTPIPLRTSRRRCAVAADTRGLSTGGCAISPHPTAVTEKPQPPIPRGYGTAAGF